MRTSILFIALLLATTGMARKMFVVVHTSDRVVREYVCRTDGIAEVRQGRQIITRAGGFNWHVVNGVPPYTVIHSDRDGVGSNCVTVIDAVGNVATGCGIVQVFVETVYENCNLRTPGPAAPVIPDSIVHQGRVIARVPPPVKTPLSIVRTPDEKLRTHDPNYRRPSGWHRDPGQSTGTVMRDAGGGNTGNTGGGGSNPRPVYNTNVDRGSNGGGGGGGAGRSSSSTPSYAR